MSQESRGNGRHRQRYYGTHGSRSQRFRSTSHFFRSILLSLLLTLFRRKWSPSSSSVSTLNTKSRVIDLTNKIFWEQLNMKWIWRNSGSFASRDYVWPHSLLPVIFPQPLVKDEPKRLISDFSIIKRIHFTYERMLRRFREDESLWKQYRVTVVIDHG